MFEPMHQARLNLIHDDVELPENVKEALKKIRTLFSEEAKLFCEEAYKPQYNIATMEANLRMISLKFHGIIKGMPKDLQNMKCVDEYLETAIKQIKMIPPGTVFNPNMITSLLDVFQCMKNIACDSLTLPYCV